MSFSWLILVGLRKDSLEILFKKRKSRSSRLLVLVYAATITSLLTSPHESQLTQLWGIQYVPSSESLLTPAAHPALRGLFPNKFGCIFSLYSTWMNRGKMPVSVKLLTLQPIKCLHALHYTTLNTFYAVNVVIRWFSSLVKALHFC